MEVADNRGVPPAQIALAWLFTKPMMVSPVIGATKRHHLEDAVAATKISLTVEEIRLLEELYTPRKVVGAL